MGFITYLKNIKLFGLEYYKRYYASYRATVLDNADPDNLGRLKLSIPQIHNGEYDYWAEPKGLYSGNGTGSFVIPENGDNIWVEFENGDAKYPIWNYGWWDKDQVPVDATVNNKMFATPTGNKIEYDDDNKLIRITSAKGKVIEISDKISLGSKDESSEPAVLGDTLKEKLENILDKFSNTLQGISTLTVATALGTSSVPLNSATFTQLKIEVNNLKQTLEDILSKEVTLD